MYRRVPIRAIAVTSALAATVTGCSVLSGGHASEPMHLTVTAASWSGWTTPPTVTDGSVTSPQTPAKDPTFHVNATEGESVTVDETVGDDLTITVESVTETDVEISTSERMSPRGDGGGISLDDTMSNFTVTKGDKLEFATPTMDAGTSFTITLKEGPAPTGGSTSPAAPSTSQE